MKLPLLSFLFSVCLLPTVQAQSPQLQLRGGPAATTAVDRSQARTLFVDQRDAIAGLLIRCLLFDHTLRAEERKQLVASGIRFMSPLRPHAWVVSVPVGMDATALFDHGLIAFSLLGQLERTDPRLHREMTSAGGHALQVVVVPWPAYSSDFGTIVDRIVPGSTPHGHLGARTIEASVDDLQRLLAYTQVQWMEPLPPEGQPEDLRGRSYHRINRIGPTIPNGTGLDGTGVIVVVNDDGFVGPHIDFKGRTEQSAVIADTLGTHGDMVAGIVGAAGNIDPHAVGMAPGCDLIIAPYLGELPLTVPLYESQNAVIFNSSYSNGCNAGYTATTQQVDAEIVDHPAIIQVFSAGNEGENDCGYGAGSSWGTISGGHKIGKNVIATANLTDVDGLVPSSSRGPSADGRIKPDISAYGNGQQSNAPGNAYMTGSGTSAASPGMAGVMALLYQGWHATHSGADPPSALLKAFVLNTADDLGNAGPDYKYGWGAVNGERAWRAIMDERWMSVTIDNGELVSPQIDVPANIAELRVMAYWMDPAGELLAANALVNDIDLAGIDAGGNTHMPWVLSIEPDPTSLNAPAVQGADHLNNMEQVRVVDPSPGIWTFPLLGFDIPEGPQEVFIVYEFLPRTIDITWPQDGERLTVNSTHRFRWDTPDRTTPVTMRYSINGGGSWNSFTLASGQRFFDLAMGDTVLSDLRVRVEQGSWADERSGINTMRTPVQLNVATNCVDSALLEWPAVQYAESYIVHKLGDRYMEAVDTIATTSFWFTGLSAVHDDWFAVTAIAPGGIVGERSIAIARPQELVGCAAQQDLIVLEVIAPLSPVIACQPQTPVSFTVRNEGLEPVVGFNAGVINTNGIATPTSFPATIAPGATITVTLPLTDLALVPGQLNTMRVWASGLTEQFPLNDTLSFSLYVHDLTDQYPYVQNMEDFTNCTEPGLCDVLCPLGLGLVNGLNGIEDVLDWRVDSAGTNSMATGPDVDHTFGTPQGHYVYMEATGPCSSGEAHLLLPCFTVPTGTVALMYSYHMLGAGMGSLHVDLLVNGTWQLDAATPVDGDQGNQWLPGLVDLSPYAGSIVNVRFRGVRGPNHLSDMALDDIHVSSAVGIEENAASPMLAARPLGDGRYMISAPSALPGTITVHDALGRIIITDRVGPGTSFTLDLGERASGVFTIAWTDGSARAVTRIVK